MGQLCAKNEVGKVTTEVPPPSKKKNRTLESKGPAQEPIK